MEAKDIKNAKDTVNMFVKIDFISLLNMAVEEIKEQQAIISFQAGYEQAIKDGKKLGISQQEIICDGCGQYESECKCVE